MSHMAAIDLQIQDLEDLDTACKALGLQLIRNQSHWRWYGSWMNDYSAEQAAYRHGIKPEEYGKCADHVITIPGDDQCYQIGVVRRRDGQPGWLLVYDFFAGGRGMTAKVGSDNCGKLKQEYTLAQSARKLKLKGFQPAIVEGKNGHKICVARRLKQR